jgi:hypothetical protein
VFITTKAAYHIVLAAFILLLFPRLPRLLVTLSWGAQAAALVEGDSSGLDQERHVRVCGHAHAQALAYVLACSARGSSSTPLSG